MKGPDGVKKVALRASPSGIPLTAAPPSNNVPLTASPSTAIDTPRDTAAKSFTSGEVPPHSVGRMFFPQNHEAKSISGMDLFTPEFMGQERYNALVKFLPLDLSSLGEAFQDFLFPDKAVVLFYRQYGFNVYYKKTLRSLNGFASVWAETVDGDYISCIAGNLCDPCLPPKLLKDCKWSIKKKGTEHYQPIVFDAVPFDYVIEKSNDGPFLDITLPLPGVAHPDAKVVDYYAAMGISVSLVRTERGTIGFIGSVTVDGTGYSGYLGNLFCNGLSIVQCRTIDWTEKQKSF